MPVTVVYVSRKGIKWEVYDGDDDDVDNQQFPPGSLSQFAKNVSAGARARRGETTRGLYSS